MNKANELLLGVNIDHVATLRQARGTLYPEPVQAALIAEQAGAHAITLHLREDRRHIQERDVHIFKQVLQTRMNLEMAVTEEMLAIAEALRPDDVCLVPERREELTTEGGLDVFNQQGKISSACERLAEAGIRVSLFIDADKNQIDAAKACSAPVIEIHTGHYASAKSTKEKLQMLDQIRDQARYADELGLQVNAGHGLDYHNTQPIAAIPQIKELNIGHSIIARSIFTGLETAVRDMLRIMRESRE